jgi:hypothetical protein
LWGAFALREGNCIVEGALFNRNQNGGAVLRRAFQVSGAGLELDALAAAPPLEVEVDLD